jgi:hypothetical protein
VAFGIFAAASVGAAHLRRRWYCLAVKPAHLPRLLPPAPSSMTADFSERVARFRKRTRASRRDMVVRCGLLGNAVVPQCAAHAYALLLDSLRLKGARQHGAARVTDSPSCARARVTVTLDCADGAWQCGTVVKHAWATPTASHWDLRTLHERRRLQELVNQLFYDRRSKDYLRRRMGYKGAIPLAAAHFDINPTWVEHLMGYPTGWTQAQ